MSYIALYRKWRPLVFEDVVEQAHVVRTLKNSVMSGRIGHAYLFCGTRGTGKTTVARIFSRAINCLNPRDGDPCNECAICRGILDNSLMDVIEIDAASNNSVDDIRDIRDEVIYSPTRAKYKVYIIDEVHMLSTGAFNGLLKTLEEPPSHAVFFLATTEPHKLPATILSRCQRFDFRRISIDSIIERLDIIAAEGGSSMEKAASRLIAKLADGALRDAISILDQCLASGNKEITYNDVLSVVGIVNEAFTGDMAEALLIRNVEQVLNMTDKLVMEGKDLLKFVSDMIQYYRNLMVCSSVKNPSDIIDASPDYIDRLVNQSKRANIDEIMLVIKELSQLESSLKWAGNMRVLLEVTLIRICRTDYSNLADSLAERLALLEEKLKGNLIAAPLQQIPAERAAPEAANAASAGSKPEESRSKTLPGKADGSADTNRVAPGKPLEKWNEIVEALKKSGRMALYTSLLDTKAIMLSDKVLGIVFSREKGFNRMLVSKAENVEIVAEAAAKKLGHEVHIKCIDDEQLEVDTKVKKEEKKDEFVEKAVSIAKRLDIPVEIIDE